MDTILVISFCDTHWLVPYLIPFLFGLILGWLWFSRFKDMIIDLQNELNIGKEKYQNLHHKYNDVKSHNINLESEINILNNKISKFETHRPEIKYVDKIIEKPVEVIVEKFVEIPVERIIEKIVYTSNTPSLIQDPEKPSIISNDNVEPQIISSSNTPIILDSHLNYDEHKNNSIEELEFDDNLENNSMELADNQNLIAKSTEIDLAVQKDNEDETLFDKINNNELQIIEGIGPKSHEILNKNNIFTWQDLSNFTGTDLKNLLVNEDSRKFIGTDTHSWARQARLAQEHKWEELISYQKKLHGGKEEDENSTESKIERMLIKLNILRRWKKDDLKAIEGIGPKTEKLLQTNNILTWEHLSTLSLDELYSILIAGGPRFKLVNPTTWAKQASLAAQGEWKKLQEYQDKLIKGIE